MAKAIQSFYDWCIENKREDLLTEYSSKNDKSPKDFGSGSGYKAIWELPYDDPKTGRHFDFVWKGTINSRTRQNHKCPYLSNQMIMEGFNDLKTWCEMNERQDLIDEYSPKNPKPMTAYTCATNKKVLWHLPYDDPKTGKHFDFEWESAISNRTSGHGCPYLPSAGTKRLAWKGYNDAETWCIENNRENLIEQFSSKNELSLFNYTYGSEKVVLWCMPYDDPETGKHFDFEWEDSICNRTVTGCGCPYLTGKAGFIGFNDLESWSKNHNRLDIIEQYSYKNEKPITKQNYRGCNTVLWSKKVLNKETGEMELVEWEQSISDRVDNIQPRFNLSGEDIHIKYNNLRIWCIENNREELINQFSKKNAKKITDYAFSSKDKAIWELPYDDPITGKHFDFVWEQRISDRTMHNCGCPYLVGQAIWVGFNDLKTWCQVNKREELIKQFSPKNKQDITEFTGVTDKKVLWVLPYDDPKTGKHFNFEWEAPISRRTSSNQGCPYLSGAAVWVGFNDLVTTHYDIAKEWHPTKNGDKQPSQYTYGSNAIVWWSKLYFDPKTHEMKYLEWQQRINKRTMSNEDCPYIQGSSMEQFAYDYLLNHNISFTREKSFKDIKGKRFDIYIPSLNLAIEIDGEQHFTDKYKFFESGNNPFAKRIESDNSKNKYCRNKGIKLLRIPYFYNKNRDEFYTVLDEFITKGTIAKEIIDWYSKFDFSNYAEMCLNASSES